AGCRCPQQEPPSARPPSALLRAACRRGILATEPYPRVLSANLARQGTGRLATGGLFLYPHLGHDSQRLRPLGPAPAPALPLGLQHRQRPLGGTAVEVGVGLRHYLTDQV